MQPTSDSGETSTVADGSINISMSRKLTTNEIEIARQKELQQLILDEHRLTVQVKGTQAVGYFEKLAKRYVFKRCRSNVVCNYR